MNLLDFREPVSAWSHCTWMLLSLPGTYLLWRRCDANPVKRFSLLIFGFSLAFCYLASTLYHGVRGPRETLIDFDRIDHIGIFVLIAGSYTPMACCLLRGGWRWGMLAMAWILAAAGSAMFLVCGVLSMGWSTALYLGMGWAAIAGYFEMARTLSHRPLRPLLVGGILYSVGAVINLAHWPVLWPGVFGAHELFHLFVMAGSLSHFLFMYRVVAPFVPEPIPVRVEDGRRPGPGRTLATVPGWSERRRSAPG
jgi:hemolysin III